MPYNLKVNVKVTMHLSHRRNFVKTLIIIPAYNEEESLKATIDSVQKEAPDVDFLIVNDGSTDGTERVCRENHYPFLGLATNLGLAGAFQAGLKYANRHGYDCAIQFDARFLDKKKPHSMRMLGSNLIQGAIKITTGKTITDPTSGMRAFNKRMIFYMANGLNFGPEPDTVSYLIKRANAKVVEVPVEMQDRMAGESYLSPFRSMAYMMRMAISILFLQFFRKQIGGGGR